jgi:predicted nucleic acid-binding protein
MTERPLIYLDNCCFNRPFDDQEQLKIRIETEAKLFLQEKVRLGEIALVWSFMLNLENDRNPFEEKRRLIAPWEKLATVFVPALAEIKPLAQNLAEGFHLRHADSAHLACAIHAKAGFFLTTDGAFLRATRKCAAINVINPLDWFKEGIHD